MNVVIMHKHQKKLSLRMSWFGEHCMYACAYALVEQNRSAERWFLGYACLIIYNIIEEAQKGL